jgi:hypothetical protein
MCFLHLALLWLSMFITNPNTETHGSTECACHGGLSDPLSEGWGLILAPLRVACHGGGGTGSAPVVACDGGEGGCCAPTGAKGV